MHLSSLPHRRGHEQAASPQVQSEKECHLVPPGWRLPSRGQRRCAPFELCCLRRRWYQNHKEIQAPDAQTYQVERARVCWRWREHVGGWWSYWVSRLLMSFGLGGYFKQTKLRQVPDSVRCKVRLLSSQHFRWEIDGALLDGFSKLPTKQKSGKWREHFAIN